MIKNTIRTILFALAFTTALSAQNQTFQYANASVVTSGEHAADIAISFKETAVGNAKTTFYSIGWTGSRIYWACLSKNGKLNNAAPHQTADGGNGDTAATAGTRNGSVTTTVYSDLNLNVPAGFSCPTSHTPVIYKAEYDGVTLKQVDASGNVLATANVNCGASSGTTGCNVSGNVSY